MLIRLKRLIGARRSHIIAVIGSTREEIDAGIKHAETAQSGLPIKSWCAEPAGKVRRELRQYWPALVIVAWTGRPAHTMLKLVAFTVPPFRIAVLNESRGVFAATPAKILMHDWRRFRDGLLGACDRVTDSISGAGKWLHSLCYRMWERILTFVLEPLVLVAQLTSPISHRRFQRILTSPGRDGLISEPCPNRKANVTASHVEFTFSGRVWPRLRLQRTLADYAGDFLVLRQLGETADALPLIELARQANAFAVARQVAYTGWRTQILNKHPFRVLQPNEAVEVFAPWSTLIAIRCDVLRQLGIPKATTIGAALMLLFWKAAVAGWKSLVLGHDQPITQEPAMPLEDAEFVLRLSVSNRLRSLTPPRPFARGNIAFAPSHVRPLRRLPRVLIVSPYLPFPLAHGGAVRIYNLCRALTGQVDFLLACFHEAKEPVLYPELHEVFREVYSVDIDEKHRDPALPAQIVEYRNTAMAALIESLCREKRIDVVQLEYTQMAEYRRNSCGAPVILVEHDVTFTLYRQLADPSAGLWLDFERKSLNSVDSVWTMSGHDREIAIEYGANPETTVVVPNGVDFAHYTPQARQTKGPVILFVGSFRHLPNLLAFEALRQTIMPRVWEELPACRLEVIAGPDHERAARLGRKLALLAHDPRITIHGFVEDVRPAYRECDVVAISLPVSAGTNIKLMEAMACGRPVVSTPVGCVGLGLTDGIHLLIREIGDSFADALLTLLSDPALRERMANSARAAAETGLGWDVIAQTALNDVRRLVRAASVPGCHESRISADSAIQNKCA